jgi:hypothetical protein
VLETLIYRKAPSPSRTPVWSDFILPRALFLNAFLQFTQKAIWGHLGDVFLLLGNLPVIFGYCRQRILFWPRSSGFYQ